MPTTPILSLPYPVASDTADVPRDIQALAEELDGLNPGSQRYAISGTSVTISGLNGEVDEAWEIDLFLRATTLPAAATRAIVVKPNNLSSDQITAYGAFWTIPFTANGTSYQNALPYMSVGDFESTASQTDVVLSKLVFWAKTGGVRACRSLSSHISPSSNRAYMGHYMSYWSDTTMPITSLVFDFSGVTANGFAMLRKV